MSRFFKDKKLKITKEQSREFGMVLVLIMSFLAFRSKEYIYIKITFIFALISVIFPLLLFPFAFCWFALSRKLEKLSSVILLSIVFLLVVIPIGLLRRVAGIDNLKLKQFKKSKITVLTDRNHLYTDADLLHTF